MSDLTITELWFKRAKPEPTEKDFNVQLGCHIEEIVEMFDTLALQGQMFPSGTMAGKDTSVRNKLKTLADDLKKGTATAVVQDRVEFLDALADQIVTATGSGYMAGMKVPQALAEVNSSNFSKFDSNGMPTFDENGKIKKGESYRKPNLTNLV